MTSMTTRVGTPRTRWSCRAPVASAQSVRGRNWPLPDARDQAADRPGVAGPTQYRREPPMPLARYVVTRLECDQRRLAGGGRSRRRQRVRFGVGDGLTHRCPLGGFSPHARLAVER
jgi:hypothetical protein